MPRHSMVSSHAYSYLGVHQVLVMTCFLFRPSHVKVSIYIVLDSVF